MTSAADQNANVIFGAVIDDQARDEVHVTVIATGFGAQRRRRGRPTTEAVPAARARPNTDFDVSSESLEVPSFLRED